MVDNRDGAHPSHPSRCRGGGRWCHHPRRHPLRCRRLGTHALVPLTPPQARLAGMACGHSAVSHACRPVGRSAGRDGAGGGGATRGRTTPAERPIYGAPHSDHWRRTRTAAQRHLSPPSCSAEPDNGRRPYRRDGVVRRNGRRVVPWGMQPAEERCGRTLWMPHSLCWRRGTAHPRRGGALHGHRVLRPRRGWRNREERPT